MTGIPISDLEPDIDKSVVRARTLATLAHRGQVDKNGQPYIDHPRRVVSYLPSVLDEFGQRSVIPADISSLATLESIAWLHDAIEDTWVTEDILSTMFDSIIVGAVTRLTRGYFSTDNRTYEQARGLEPGSEYYRIVAADPWARIVKIADLLDNTDPVRQMMLTKEVRIRLSNKYWMAADALDARDFVNGFNQDRWDRYNRENPGRHAGSTSA